MRRMVSSAMSTQARDIGILLASIVHVKLRLSTLEKPSLQAPRRFILGAFLWVNFPNKQLSTITVHIRFRGVQ